MKRRLFFGLISAIAITASVLMYKAGRESSHLSEWKKIWWVPLPLAFVCLATAAASNKKAQK